MCVLTYIPSKGKSYTLTNNRDENPNRPEAVAPKEYEINGLDVTFPKDPQGGGTWIASSALVNLVLLNGGHRVHKHSPPYRQSRGLVIIDFFSYKDEKDFYTSYEFKDIEPFTLVGVSDTQVFQIRWDEDGKTLDYFDPTLPKIWSSVTLYTPEVITEREIWFRDFLDQNPVPSPSAILNFHTTGGGGDPSTNLNMERGDLVKTLGISQVIYKKNQSHLSYFPI